MATILFTKYAITGSGDDSLDSINSYTLVGKELCIVYYSGDVYFYEYNSISTDAEDSPNTIIPNNLTVSDPGRWILLTPYGGSAGIYTEVIKSSSGSLTVKEVTKTQINNLGQTEENVQTLPTAVEGLNGIVEIGTSGAGSFHLRSRDGNLIYLEGTVGVILSITTPAIGDLIQFWSFKTGENNWDWVCFLNEGSLVGAIGLFGGGYTASASNIIDYVTIATTGNATDFGDLNISMYNLSSCSSSIRGLFGGGNTSDFIDYVTIATTGNATDFGDLTSARYGLGACSSSIRGVFGGGYNSEGNSNIIDYVTIASAGNATDFGDLSTVRYNLSSCSSSTRGLFGGGLSSTDTIDYITIATTGNATDFGDLSLGRYSLSSCSSSIRGVFGGGYVSGNSYLIDYVTITTTGNASSFGDLTIGRWGLSATSSASIGVFGGGNDNNASNVIDYVTIATTGNATDFGDLTAARQNISSCSNDHGGLQ